MGQHVSESGGGERDNGRVNSEYGISAHDLHVSVIEVKRIVREATWSSLSSISSPSSVGVKSDTVEMLNVEEETAAAGILKKGSEE